MVEAVLADRLKGVALDVYGQEPLAREGHPLSALFGRPDVILFPHLAFFTSEAMQRLSQETLARCCELLESRPVTIRSHDPRLRAQARNVLFV
ncbi:D-3-phosphoglycerate dehydrogenase [compost metagenome]